VARSANSCAASCGIAACIVEFVLPPWRRASRRFTFRVVATFSAGSQITAAMDDLEASPSTRPWLAHAQADHACMHHAREHAGDRELACDLIAHAFATYGELGMHLHADRLTSPVDTTPPRAIER
jgi:hypothetical protein